MRAKSGRLETTRTNKDNNTGFSVSFLAEVISFSVGLLAQNRHRTDSCLQAAARSLTSTPFEVNVAEAPP
jgi:hypothetical protein